MKTISQNTEAQWDNKLLKDLDFIKKKLRYPYSTKTIGPIVVILAITVLAFAVQLVSILERSAMNKPLNFLPLVFNIAIFVPLIVAVIRNINSLKFVSIPSPLPDNENQLLVEAFLRSQHLVVYRHPDAGEVYQIISKRVDQYKDQREVMIFIADDKRILINSHFTNQGFVLLATAPHRKEMSESLRHWIITHSNNTSAIPSH